MSKSQIIFLRLLLAITLSFSGHFARAEDTPSDARPFGNFEVGLPGLPAGSSIDRFAGKDEPILEFINLVVNTVIAVLVIIGLISIVIGGYIYMTAAGDGSRVKLAKEMILAAIFGIVLSLVSVIILNTINRYIGSGATEPELGESSPGSGSGGEGSGLGNGNNGGSDGSGTLPGNQENPGNNNEGTNGGGGNLPGGNQVLFDSTVQRSTPQITTIIIDGENYYFRDSNGFDHPTTLGNAVRAAQNSEGGADNLKIRVYQSSSARTTSERALRDALGQANISGLQVHWADTPIGYR
jgi:hypothetical protein